MASTGIRLAVQQESSTDPQQLDIDKVTASRFATPQGQTPAKEDETIGGYHEEPTSQNTEVGVSGISMSLVQKDVVATRLTKSAITSSTSPSVPSSAPPTIQLESSNVSPHINTVKSSVTPSTTTSNRVLTTVSTGISTTNTSSSTAITASYSIANTTTTTSRTTPSPAASATPTPANISTTHKYSTFDDRVVASNVGQSSETSRIGCRDSDTCHAAGGDTCHAGLHVDESKSHVTSTSDRSQVKVVRPIEITSISSEQGTHSVKGGGRGGAGEEVSEQDQSVRGQIVPRSCQYQRNGLLQNNARETGMSPLERFLAEKELEMSLSAARNGRAPQSHPGGESSQSRHGESQPAATLDPDDVTVSLASSSASKHAVTLEPRTSQYQADMLHDTEVMLCELDRLLDEKSAQKRRAEAPLQPRTLQYEENTLLETKDDQGRTAIEQFLVEHQLIDEDCSYCSSGAYCSSHHSGSYDNRGVGAGVGAPIGATGGAAGRGENNNRTSGTSSRGGKHAKNSAAGELGASAGGGGASTGGGGASAGGRVASGGTAGQNTSKHVRFKQRSSGSIDTVHALSTKKTPGISKSGSAGSRPSRIARLRQSLRMNKNCRQIAEGESTSSTTTTSAAGGGGAGERGGANDAGARERGGARGGANANAGTVKPAGGGGQVDATTTSKSSCVVS